MNRSDWVWMPHPAHFIAARHCDFRLATYVGGYIVSTVGEMRRRDGAPGFEEVGDMRTYETMVFRAVPSRHVCCPWEITDVGNPVDTDGYNDAGEATRGHMRLCEKWAREDA